MANKGLQFEWCIYHLVAKVNPKKFLNDPNAKIAKTNYNSSDKTVRKGASDAITNMEKMYGKVKNIEKTSGGGSEPKTDLYITCARKALRCSLKYGGSIQLSSGGITATVTFLNGVLKNLIACCPGYNIPKIKSIISTLAELDDKFGDLGKMPRQKADVTIGKAEKYNDLLKNIIGSSQNPTVSGEYEKIKLAIIEEAITGKFTFGANSKRTADHILSEKKLEVFNATLLKKIADKTSVRIALKGRGKQMVAGEEVRLNEVVIRFDTKT
jgi:hypothetical protein